MQSQQQLIHTESIQIAQVNLMLLKKEIPEYEALKRIAIIRKRFDEIYNTPNNQ